LDDDALNLGPHCRQVLARAPKNLAAINFVLAQGLGDFLVFVIENFTKDEDGSPRRFKRSSKVRNAIDRDSSS